MSLSDEQKRKIEEEENYRAQVRADAKSEKPKKKGLGLVKWLLIIIIGIPFLIAIIMNTGSNPSSDSSIIPTPTVVQEDLKGTVNFDGEYFTVVNQEDRNWTDCWLTLNKDYIIPQDISTTRFDVEANTERLFRPGDITKKDGTRFNPYTTKPSNVSIACKEGNGYWTW